jgi:hypothetical protein
VKLKVYHQFVAHDYMLFPVFPKVSPEEITWASEDKAHNAAH